jgi:AraC family transcriptional regulator of adaptative response/methylated-DNA-[protein]-cysteine methyltransferase
VDKAIARACDYLTRNADKPVTLVALAREVGLSAFHLQRAFKRAMGISPREYHDAERHRRLAERLRRGDTVSRATYEAGFGSSSRIYEDASRSMGMTPAALKKGGAGQRIQFSIVDSPLGRLLVGYTERGVCSVAIGDDDRDLERAFRADFAEAEIYVAGPVIHEWIAAIVRSIDGGSSSTAIPLDARGTAFQRRVWNALQLIPRGTTLSYSDVARKIGRPSAVRAVARACATNPVALVVPCHRVIREDGSLGGYRWGIDRKQELLAREKSS